MELKFENTFSFTQIGKCQKIGKFKLENWCHLILGPVNVIFPGRKVCQSTILFALYRDLEISLFSKEMNFTLLPWKCNHDIGFRFPPHFIVGEILNIDHIRGCVFKICVWQILRARNGKRYVPQPHWSYVPPMRFSISISSSLLRLTLDDKSIVEYEA